MSELFRDDNILFEDRDALDEHGQGDHLFFIDGEYRVYTAKRVSREKRETKCTIDAASYRVLTAEEAKRFCHERVSPQGTYCSLRALRNCEDLEIFEPQDDDDLRHAEQFCNDNNGGTVTPCVKGYEDRHGQRPPPKK